MQGGAKLYQPELFFGLNIEFLKSIQIILATNFNCGLIFLYICICGIRFDIKSKVNICQ